MEEKSLEEMMADISSNVTTASTTSEQITIDMKDIPVPEQVSIVSQSSVEETKTMTLGGWATSKNIRLLETKYYDDTNLYTYEQYLNIVPRNIEVPLMAEGMKPEVQEMVEEQYSDFFNQNINKDMNVLEKEFVSMERKAAKIDAKIAMIKEQHSEIFKEIEELEKEKEEILKPKEDYREVIARKMFLIGEKKWKGLEVEFTYCAATFKDKFNSAKFKIEQPNMYAKYVEKTPVKEYIKTKLSLLPNYESLEDEKNV